MRTPAIALSLLFAACSHGGETLPDSEAVQALQRIQPCVLEQVGNVLESLDEFGASLQLLLNEESFTEPTTGISNSEIESFSWSPDSNFFITGQDGRLTFWQIDSIEPKLITAKKDEGSASSPVDKKLSTRSISFAVPSEKLRAMVKTLLPAAAGIDSPFDLVQPTHANPDTRANQADQADGNAG